MGRRRITRASPLSPVPCGGFCRGLLEGVIAGILLLQYGVEGPVYVETALAMLTYRWWWPLHGIRTYYTYVAHRPGPFPSSAGAEQNASRVPTYL